MFADGGGGGCAGLHLLTEVMKLGFEDRNTYTGDPAFLDVPVDMLVSKVTTTNIRLATARAGARAEPEPGRVQELEQQPRA